MYIWVELHVFQDGGFVPLAIASYEWQAQLE
jgi:hypothetical protein